VPDLKS